MTTYHYAAHSSLGLFSGVFTTENKNVKDAITELESKSDDPLFMIEWIEKVSESKLN